MEYDTPTLEQGEKIEINNNLKIRGVILGVFFIFFIFISSAPSSFEEGSYITIEEGYTIRDSALLLKEKNIIRSPFLFIHYIRLIGGDIQQGTYYFEKKEGIFRVALRIHKGERDIPKIKITIPEGFTISQIGTRLEEFIPTISAEEFKKEASSKEGYLFPDTYFFEIGSTPENIIKEMSFNYEEKIKPLRQEFEKNNLSEKEVITLASIVEKEANTEKDMKIVAGILLTRLSIGMALQVDATFLYSIGKGSAELTLEDLQNDGPYNTYTRRGIPPTPIGNPGLTAIHAVLYEEKSPFLYYLTGKDGTMHYARTFEEHVFNKEKYLR